MVSSNVTMPQDCTRPHQRDDVPRSECQDVCARHDAGATRLHCGFGGVDGFEAVEALVGGRRPFRPGGVDEDRRIGSLQLETRQNPHQPVEAPLRACNIICHAERLKLVLAIAGRRLWARAKLSLVSLEMKNSRGRTRRGRTCGGCPAQSSCCYCRTR